MDKSMAKHELRHINELYYELELMREREDELKQKIMLLKHEGFPVGLVHADFLENSGRYVFLDDLMGR